MRWRVAVSIECAAFTRRYGTSLTLRVVMRKVDPTLPRYGTDFIDTTSRDAQHQPLLMVKNRGEDDHEKKARVRIRRPYRARIIDSHRGAWERATRELFRAADTLCSRSAHRDGAGTDVAF